MGSNASRTSLAAPSPLTRFLRQQTLRLPSEGEQCSPKYGPDVCVPVWGGYAHARLKPIPDPGNFEEWVINQFGRKLYNMFFKTYTEKVLGIPCTEIGADWAAQRIKGLNLGEAIRSAIVGKRNGPVIKTLIDEFRYPRLGPGQLWESCADLVTSRGWTILKQTKVTGIRVRDGKVKAVKATRNDGSEMEIPCSNLLSSMPLKELVLAIDSQRPIDVESAARALAYRDFLTVALVLDAKELFRTTGYTCTLRMLSLAAFKIIKTGVPKWCRTP